MNDEKRSMEVVRILDLGNRSCGSFVGISDKKRHTTLSGYRTKTTAVAAGSGISHCLDDPVCADGHWDCQGISDSKLNGPFPRDIAISDPVGI